MEVGDKVVYIFTPYKDGSLSTIVLARVKRKSVSDINRSFVVIDPIEVLYGESGTYGQIINRGFIYEYGDHEIIEMVFEKEFRS